jgi:hypothetical protein
MLPAAEYIVNHRLIRNGKNVCKNRKSATAKHAI